MDSKEDAPAVLRRKRKIARQQRDKTPEPRMAGLEYSDDDDDDDDYVSADQVAKSKNNIDLHRKASLSPIRQRNAEQSFSRQISSSPSRQQTLSPHRTVITKDDSGNAVQSVSMQIRPPGKMSAHESKILRKRNRSFAGTVARSQSQPGARDVPIEPLNEKNFEVNDLMRTARRSLSSGRHREDVTSEDSSTAPSTPAIEQYSPLLEMQRKLAAGSSSADEIKLSKLQKNLQKFEDERRRFEMEKKKFEREKREMHKIRYRQLMEAEERRRMLASKRRGSDSDDRFQAYPLNQVASMHRVRSPHQIQEPPITHKQNKSQDNKQPHSILKHRKNYESSSAMSGSDSEAIHGDIEYESTPQKPLIQNTRQINQHLVEPPLMEAPPIPPERKRSLSRGSSRKNSSSPVKNRTGPLETKIDPKLEALLQNVDQTNTADLKEAKPGFISKFFTMFRRKATPDTIPINESRKIEPDEPDLLAIKIFSLSFIKLMFRDFRREWTQMKLDHPQEVKLIQSYRNKCLSHFIIFALFCGFGGLMFRFIEGGFENAYKCEVRKVKRDFIDALWTQSHSMREDDWKTQARNKLRKFEEELHIIHELGLTYHAPKNNKWDFINSVLYCMTVITSIGYGHIAPQTTLGRTVTIIYAIIGIPMFLILLADFGKLFTRCIKFVWGSLRRLYYTGTCRKVRKNQQMQNVMKGIDMAYDVAIRRPSMFIRDIDIENHDKENDPSTPQTHHSGTNPETPTSQYPETIIVDDEFNLPISVATVILVMYIVCGAMIYATWEDWTYFESFYFVFISMSTIGFGDFVPNHPIFMMCSIVYLVFGLALTSMFINVVQIKLSDSFKQASAKISATIGLTLAEEEMSKNSQIGETPEGPSSPQNGNLSNISERDENSSSPPLPPPRSSNLSKR